MWTPKNFALSKSILPNEKIFNEGKILWAPAIRCVNVNVNNKFCPPPYEKRMFIFVQNLYYLVWNSNIPVIQVFWDLPTIPAVARYTPAVAASFSVDLYEIQQAIFKVKISVRIFFRKVKRSDFVQSLSMFNF